MTAAMVYRAHLMTCWPFVAVESDLATLAWRFLTNAPRSVLDAYGIDGDRPWGVG